MSDLFRWFCLVLDRRLVRLRHKGRVFPTKAVWRIQASGEQSSNPVLELFRLLELPGLARGSVRVRESSFAQDMDDKDDALRHRLWCRPPSSLRRRTTRSLPIACTPTVSAATRIAMKPVILSFAHSPLPFFSLCKRNETELMFGTTGAVCMV
jgi:hypothetical protein